MLEVAHVIIILAYTALAFLALVLEVGGSGWRTWIARVSGASFFLGCAGTHALVFGHLGGTAFDPDAFNHIVPTLMQALGAPIFITAAAPKLKDLWDVLAVTPTKGGGESDG